MKKKNLLAGIVFTCLSAGAVFAATPKYIGIEKAKAIALSKIPGGTVVSTELDYEKGRSIYDIDVILNQYEYDLKIDAVTGSGISVKKELRDGYKNIAPTKPATGTTKQFITLAQAKQIAAKQVQGSIVTDIELEREDGVYEAELRKGYKEYDVVIDAFTGAVLYCQIDS